MFDRIANRYDLLNGLISLRFDRHWRHKIVAELLTNRGQLILDIGTGTGDLSFAAAKNPRADDRIFGLDASLGMLKLARSKQEARSGRKIVFVQGSATLAPFKDSLFDAAMTAFVLRNISDLPQFFAEGFRLLKPGGRIISIDMFPPTRSWFSPLYAVYFYHVVPWIGAVVARDASAYRYLAESVKAFSAPEAIAELIEAAGFRQIVTRKFLKGAVCMHVGTKPVISTRA
jgi:demethylmenaquinone methyltransferase / 2-methoxy-6-polyprenyl-1,4-benzoquinol methylase